LRVIVLTSLLAGIVFAAVYAVITLNLITLDVVRQPGS
jgi:hypothetical protein